MPDSLAHAETLLLGPDSAVARSETAARSGGFPTWLAALIAVALVGLAGATWWLQREPAAQPALVGASSEVPIVETTPALAAETPSAPVAIETAPALGRDVEPAPKVAAPSPATAAAKAPMPEPEPEVRTATPAPSVAKRRPAPASAPTGTGAAKRAPATTRSPPVSKPVRQRQAIAAPAPAPAPASEPKSEPKPEPAAPPETEPDWGGGFQKGTTRRLD